MALKQLRDSMKYLQWILWVMAIAFVFALVDTSYLRQGAPVSSDVAATVGSSEITYSEFRQYYRNLEDRYRQMFGERWDSEMVKQFGIARQALDQAVNRKILLMEADRIGLRVSDDEVKQVVREIFTDADGKFLGAERINRYLRSQRLTQAQFVESVREDTLIDKLNQVMAATTYVSDDEVERSWRRDNEKAKIRFVKLPATEIGDVTPSDDEIGAYYESHQADYQLPEQRQAEILLVDRTKLRDQIEVADEQLRAYYDENIADFTREEQVRARHILLRVGPDRDQAAAEALAEQLKARIAAGEDFGELARQYSEDPSNAERGGDLGQFGRGAMVAPFEQAAFGAEPGTVVGPVTTDFGVHLIDVISKSPGGAQQFEQVKAVVQARVVNDRVEELAEAKAKEIAAGLNAETTTADLQAVADAEETVELVTPAPFGPNDSVERIGRVPDFTSVVFAAEKGTVTEPVKVPRGWVVARVADVLPSRIPTLDEVRDQVQQAVAVELRKEAAVARLNESAAAVAAGETSLDDVAGELGLEVQESEEFAATGSITGIGRNRAVIDAALSMDEGAVSEAIQVADGAVLFEVTARTKFDPEAFAEAKESATEDLVAQRVQRLLASVIEQRRRDLQPTYNPQVVEDFDITPDAT